MKLKNITTLFACFMGFLLFFTNVEIVSQSIISSARFCFLNIVPSLFPYMTICSFLLYSSAFDGFLSKISIPFCRYFGICQKYLASIILGSLCGFVTGAKSINELSVCQESGDEDLTKEVLLSSNAGCGFVIGCLGIRIWNSTVFGIYVYLSQITVSLLLSKLIRKNVVNHSYTQKSESISLISAFTKAVSSSSFSIVSIISFFVFFSFCISTVCSLFSYPFSENIEKLLNIFFEFSKGTFSSVSFDNILLCAFLSGFCIGFGGICAHFQIFSVCDKITVSKLKFTIFKFIQGILCGILSLIFVSISKISPSKQTFNFEIHKNPQMIIAILLLTIIICFEFRKKNNVF